MGVAASAIVDSLTFSSSIISPCSSPAVLEQPITIKLKATTVIKKYVTFTQLLFICKILMIF